MCSLLIPGAGLAFAVVGKPQWRALENFHVHVDVIRPGLADRCRCTFLIDCMLLQPARLAHMLSRSVIKFAILSLGLLNICSFAQISRLGQWSSARMKHICTDPATSVAYAQKVMHNHSQLTLVFLSSLLHTAALS